MIEDPLQYKGIPFLRAEVDFSGSEKMEKSRRVYLVFLTVLLFIEFAGVEIQSATLAVVTAKVHRPTVVTMGFWMLFLYTFMIYFLAAQKELALFSLKNAKADNFFCELNRRDFERQLYELYGGQGYPMPGSGLVKHQDDSSTSVQYKVGGIPEDMLVKVAGFDPSTRTFMYTHTQADHAYFKKAVPVLRPALRLNYLVYVFPAHVGAGLIGYSVVRAIYGYLGILT